MFDKTKDKARTYLAENVAEPIRQTLTLAVLAMATAIFAFLVAVFR